MDVNMGNVLGLVFANMHDTTLGDMTKNRTMGSVMFGGRYRLIDFPLSNMVNSGISGSGKKKGRTLHSASIRQR